MSFKETLMTALNTAVENRNAGAADNDAVAKAASDHGLNTEQTRRLTETYNTAKTIYYYKSAEARDGSFPIADPDVVLGIMVTPEAQDNKTAAASVGLYDYTEYDQVETDLLDGTDKAAASLHTEVETINADRTDDDTIYSLQKNSADIRRTATHCHSAADMCLVKYTEAVDKIATFVQTSHGSNPDICAEVAGGIEAALGKEAAGPVLTALSEWLHPVYKTATCPPDFSTFDQDHPLTNQFIKDAGAALAGFAESKAAADQFEKMAEEFETQWKEIMHGPTEKKADSWVDDVLPGEFHKKAQGAPSSYNVGDLLADTGKTAPAPGGGMTDAITGAVGKGMTGALTPSLSNVLEPAKGDSSEKLNLQEKLRNVQRQQILEDLMTNDDVLAGEDPMKVVSAYQSLLQTAPHVSTNKEVVRSVLRQASQAMSVSPFDAKSWADLESSIQKQMQTPTKENAQ
jgi:formiminotetrahydrofolate cyclodeaminase